MTCVKKRFTKRGAARALKRISVWRIWGDPNRREVRAYRCDYCQRWHLTSYTEEAWKQKQAAIEAATAG